MMKGSGKIIVRVGIVASLMLLYVHQQFLLFHTSYAIDQKSHSLNDKTESFRRIKFEVDQLTAPRLLEEHMRDLKLDLSLPKEVNVVKIPDSYQSIIIPVHEVPLQQFSDRLYNWLGRWVDVAQAKVDNHE
ncbi:MAG: hypothetical protein EXS63_04925 [Candidatus Omnitrophica bacterium]|nr:hypothetical protein [Candidatus Omnitrophota bacterium]